MKKIKIIVEGMFFEALKEQKKLLEEIFLFSFPKFFKNKKINYSHLETVLEEGKLLFIPEVEGPAFRLKRDFKGLLTGTILTKEFIIPGFPHIPRIFCLKTSLSRYLPGPFYVEEKIEGYNIRLCKIYGKIYAFTRRGYVCPLATDRWPDFLPTLPSFLKKYPHYVLCCEVAGPENPFVTEFPPYIKEDIKFFVFDILDLKKGTFLKPEEKYSLFKEYGFLFPEVHGPFKSHNLSEIKNLIYRYDNEGREGLVFKPQGPEGRILKYVTPRSNIEDIKISFPFTGELEASYIVHRLVRLAISKWELEQDFDEAFYKEIGEAILGEMKEVLSKIAQGHPVEETFNVRLRKEESLEKLIAHFRRAQVRIEIKEQRWDGRHYKIKFVKVYPRATSFWRHKLEGWAQID